MYVKSHMILFTLLVVSGASFSSAASELLHERALKLSSVEATGACPVSMGRHDLIPRFGGNVFCDTCAWHGDGPVYLAFAWAPPARQAAWFVLSDVRNVSNGIYSVKTPVVADPDYEGPILIRGQRLDARSEQSTLTPGATAENAANLEVRANDLSNWSFIGWGMKISEPGCYGLQIDTKDATSIVIFEAME